MNRRETTLALLGLGTSLGPHIACAQTPAKMVTVGLLSRSSAPTAPESDRTPIAAGLKALGWVEGKNLRIEPAYADGSRERLLALAEELVRKKVILIYVHGPDAGFAAQATTTIPIVFFGPTFPVEMGLVDSYARPGKNVTGVAWSAGIQLYEKLLEFVKEVVPSVTRVAYLRQGAPPGLEPAWWTEAGQRLEKAARTRGLEVRAFNVTGPGDFASAFESIKTWRAQALFCHQTPMFFSARQSITDFASASRIPGFFDTRYVVEAGGLFSYGPDVTELFGQSVRIVDQILRGANPAYLPVEMPTRYEMFVNLKTATGLGIKFPQTLLLRADRVIE